MSKTSNFLIGVATGLAVGAVLGILYAPEEGSSTRDKLSYQLSKYRERLAEMLKKLGKDGEGSISYAKAEGEKVIADVRNEAQDMLSAIDNLMAQMKDLK